MNQGLIPQRYAKALYKVAIERKCTEPLYSMMKNLNGSFESNPDLGRAIENPFVAADKKRQLLCTAAAVDTLTGRDDVASNTFTDFVTLLERNKRIEYARGTALAYIDRYRKERNISTVTVTSASTLDTATSARLMSIIKSQHPDGTIEYQEKVDPELIGGFTIAIDNMRLDASIKNELKQLRLKLLSH